MIGLSGLSTVASSYVLALELISHDVEQLRGILFELGHRSFESGYIGDEIVMILDAPGVETVGTILRQYESVVRGKINAIKCLRARVGTSAEEV